MDNKLRIKDLVLVAAFSVLGIAFMYLIPMPFLFTPYTILISPIVQSLFLALPFILTGAKVQKKCAILIYCLMGIGWNYALLHWNDGYRGNYCRIYIS
ncbi:MptD family putative ECF transporter S component [Streptococcus ovis]|uniref:MptD family putative ECF transporter S component n=1 Tax=Streptococcus ovis TaxID=82806 RepID=UPI000476744D|nr:MptD family putative ECF transporter S component [Streptococcus ovis]